MAGSDALEVPSDVHEWFSGIERLDPWVWLRVIAALIEPRLQEAAAQQRLPSVDPSPNDLTDRFIESMAALQRSQEARLAEVETLCRRVLWPLLERPSAEGQQSLRRAVERFPPDELPRSPAGLRPLLLLAAYSEDLATENWHREHLLHFSGLWLTEGVTLEIGSLPYPGHDDELHPEEVAANLGYDARYDEVQARLEDELRQLVRADAAGWLLPV